MSNSLPCALLLALSGGMLDAFAYLNHGRTFAAAMTGNAVLCGVAALEHDRGQVIRHAAPLVAFMLGVWLANVLASRLKGRATRVGLTAEIVGLLLLSFMPLGFSATVFVSLLALLGAYQVTSFRRVDSYAYNSTFITGNLRDAVSAFHLALDPEHRGNGLRQGRDLACVILSFLVGAVIGAILAPRLLNHTLWVICCPLAVVLLVISVRRVGQQVAE